MNKGLVGSCKNIVASTMRHAKIDKFILTSSNLIPLQMPSVLQQTQVEVEQLRREAAMKRIPVSQAVEDIKVRSERILVVYPFTG